MTIITPDWVKDAIFYQIFPDRFAKSGRVPKQGLNLESWDSPPTVFGFKGGDLRGVQDNLDYLLDLGVTAIYFNPIFASASNHRYHTYDYYSIDPLLGGKAAFRELLETAHGRGLRVILDGVFNHASRGFWQFHHVLENGAGSPYVDWFHFNSDFLMGRKNWGAYPSGSQERLLKNGTNSYDALGYAAWWSLPALPKFNTDSPAVREFLWNVAVDWLKFGIDGWRLDVAADIDDDSFWQEFRRRVKNANSEAYIVAEIWHEAQRWLKGDQFDAVMNYLLTGALLGFLLKDTIDPEVYRIGDYGKYLRPLDGPGFADRIDQIMSLYDPAINQVQLNLLDSHDTPRFLSTAHGDEGALRLGWLFILTYPGAPCIYYGDEIGMTGQADPDCRKAFPWEPSKWNLELQQYLKSLISIRRAHPALRRGTFHRLAAVENAYAYGRQLGDDSLVIAMNASTDNVVINIPIQSLGWRDGLLSALSGDARDIPVLIEGQIKELRLAPRSGVILTRA